MGATTLQRVYSPLVVQHIRVTPKLVFDSFLRAMRRDHLGKAHRLSVTETAAFSRYAFAPSVGPVFSRCAGRRATVVASATSTSPRRRPGATLGCPEGNQRIPKDDSAAPRKTRPAVLVALEDEGQNSTRSGLNDVEAYIVPAGDGAGLASANEGRSRGGEVLNEESLDAPADEDGNLIKFSLFGRDFAIPARYLLYTVPFMWGTFGPAVRVLFMSDPHPDPSVFNSERLLLANAVYFPVLLTEVTSIRQKFRGRFRRQIRAEKALAKDGDLGIEGSKGRPHVDLPDDKNPFLSIRAGCELGAYVFCANVSQVIGLQTTSASRAAFLVQLQTVFIPIIAAALGINKVSRNTWIGSVTAVAGVALLSADKSHGTASSALGDSLEVLSALFFSMYVVRLGNYCSRIEAAALVAVKLVVQAGLSVGWALSMEAILLAGPHSGATLIGDHPWTAQAIAINIAVVAWTGLISSALSGWLQSKAQRTVPASETAVIFATQPLWAGATAAIILGEAFGPKGLAGGSMIVLATIFASIPDGDESGGDGPSESKDDI